MECRFALSVITCGLTFPFHSCRRTVPITENSGLIIAVLAGRPGDASYTEAINVLYGSVTEARKDTNFTTAEKTHPRGNFASLSTGIDFPTTQFRPINLQSHHQGILDKLMSRPEVQRIASFQSGECLVDS